MIASAALRNRGPRTWAVPRWLATVLLVTRVGHGLRGAAGGVGDRQVLDTDNWTSAGSRLLENPAIRAQTPEFLADRAFEDADLQEQIRAVLPPRAQPLAAPAAGFVRDRLERRANEALARRTSSGSGRTPTAMPTPGCSRCSMTTARWSSTWTRCR